MSPGTPGWGPWVHRGVRGSRTAQDLPRDRMGWDPRRRAARPEVRSRLLLAAPHPSPTSCGPRSHLFRVFSQIHAVLCVGAGTPTSLELSRSLPRSLQPWGGHCLRLRRPQLCAAPVPGALHTGQPWRGKGGGRVRRAFRGEGPDTRLVDDPNPGVPGKATVKLVQTKVRKWSESAPGPTPRGGGREKQV